MCSEFLSLSWQTSIISSFLIEACGIFASLLDMKNGGEHSVLLSYGCDEMGVVFRL